MHADRRNAERGLRKAENRGASKQGGFSLIEVVITLVILSVAAVGVLSVFTTGIGGSADPPLLSQAVNLLQEQMETTIALRKSGGFNAVVSNPGGPFPAPFGAFSWNRVVACVNPADLNTSVGSPPCATGYAHVTVTVTHTTLGSVSAETVVTNY